MISVELEISHVGSPTQWYVGEIVRRSLRPMSPLAASEMLATAAVRDVLTALPGDANDSKTLRPYSQTHHS